MNFTTILSIGILVFVVYKLAGKFHIPEAAWKYFGLFFLICVAYNIGSAITFLKHEMHEWWPVFYKAGSSISEGIRDFVTHISDKKE